MRRHYRAVLRALQEEHALSYQAARAKYRAVKAELVRRGERVTGAAVRRHPVIVGRVLAARPRGKSESAIRRSESATLATRKRKRARVERGAVRRAVRAREAVARERPAPRLVEKEYEAKVPYTSKKDTARILVNVRLRWRGPDGMVPSDAEIRDVAYNLMRVEGYRPPAGWSWAAIDWANAKHTAHRGWVEGGTHYGSAADLTAFQAIVGAVGRDGLEIGEVA